MNIYIVIFILGLVGVGETIYLSKSKIKSQKLVCPIEGGDCGKVLESKYNRTLGIPNEFLGLFFYIFVSLVSAVLVFGNVSAEAVKWIKLIVKASIFISALFSLFLTYLQWRVIKSWCFWCLMSAFTVLLMLISVIIGMIKYD
jgi:uncharacterized membrane protein